MRILILAAMDKEVALLKEIIENLEALQIEGKELFKGNIKSHEVYLGKCSIGKVNSALFTQTFIKALNPDIVINSGVAGGANCRIGTVLVPDKVAYHDVWCGPGTRHGEMCEVPLFMTPSSEIIEISQKLRDNDEIINGLLCSGDKFISTKEEIDQIKNYFPEVKAVDMESAAIAHTCIINKVPFAIIRVVSDTPGEGENITQYQNFWEDAPRKTFKVVASILKKLN